MYILFVMLFPMIVGVACSNPGSVAIPTTDKIENKMDATIEDSLKITVGEKIFMATLLDNASTQAFKKALPLTLLMTELNGNEKYFRLSENLPVDESNQGTINPGDIMLWGSNTLVLFYKQFPTSYRYTKLGQVNNPVGLATALGSGNVTVILELK